MITLRKAAFTTAATLAITTGLAGSITQITTGADVPSLLAGAFFGVAGTVLLVIVTMEIGTWRDRRRLARQREDRRRARMAQPICPMTSAEWEQAFPGTTNLRTYLEHRAAELTTADLPPHHLTTREDR